MDPISKAIIKTLCYADIFDFPLTETEISTKLISPHTVSSPPIQQALRDLVNDKQISQTGSYYSLLGRENSIDTRIKRQQTSNNKRKRAKTIAHEIIKLPYIRSIILTGSVAVGNATTDDDLDIMVITTSRSLFTGRFFVNAWLELHQLRRHPKTNHAADKICPNLFLTEDTLSVPKSQRNLYTAHEVIQSVPLEDPDDLYSTFLALNTWTQDYLANNKVDSISRKTMDIHKHSFPLVERALRTVQLAYMAKRRTREIVTRDAAYFHPRDTSKVVLDSYNHNLNKYL